MQSLPILSLDLVGNLPTPPWQCVLPEHDSNHTIAAFNGKHFLVIIGFSEFFARFSINLYARDKKRPRNSAEPFCVKAKASQLNLLCGRNSPNNTLREAALIVKERSSGLIQNVRVELVVTQIIASTLTYLRQRA